MGAPSVHIVVLTDTICMTTIKTGNVRKGERKKNELVTKRGENSNKR